MSCLSLCAPKCMHLLMSSSLSTPRRRLINMIGVRIDSLSTWSLYLGRHKSLGVCACHQTECGGVVMESKYQPRLQSLVFPALDIQLCAICLCGASGRYLNSQGGSCDQIWFVYRLLPPTTGGCHCQTSSCGTASSLRPRTRWRACMSTTGRR